MRNQIMNSYRPALESAARIALEYLEGLDQRPIAARMHGASLRDQLNRPLANGGIPPEQVIADLARDADPGLLGSASGRFFAWVIGGALPSGLAADWLATAWDQNAVLAATSPAAAAIEEIVGAWLKDILRLPAGASFALVTGCQMAHVTCMAAARHALLEKCGWDVEELGTAGSPRIRILTSDQRHRSFERALRLLGLGSASIECLATESDGRLSADALGEALGKSRAPAIVLLQAGEINTGLYDSFAHLIPISHRHDAWVHIDGAFGLWAAASPRYRHFVDGARLADSWATDGHKWLNVPQDCGYAFVRNPEPHRASMSCTAAYLTHDTELRDQLDWTPDWSRRARAFPTYAVLRELGRSGVAEMIEQCCDHARAIVDGIGRLPGAQVLWPPTINQGLVRFLDPAGAGHDQRTDHVIAAINATGEAFFSGTTWRGMRAMRVSVCNAATTSADVERTIRAVKRVLSMPT
jgi:glutamate/tyrosine decarboxylase-like PLP-dependent enzyme